MDYDVEAVRGAARALDVMREQPPFDVVISDLRMPEMDGIRFLREARTLAPNTARILLTGQADVHAAMAAVNDGHVFRFLAKPSQPTVLESAIAAAIAQRRLVMAEHELLNETLRRSVEALLETLSLANPSAFARAMRITAVLSQVLDALEIADRWTVEVAAVLSQVGAVTLPPLVADKLHHGEDLNAAERQMVDKLPELAERLLAPIPRLEPVRDIIRWQSRRHDGRMRVPGPGGDAIPLGARLLHICVDFDTHLARGVRPAAAVDALRARRGEYDPALVEVLAACRVASSDDAAAPVEVHACDLVAGMVLASDVLTVDGVLLVAAGQQISVSLLQRIRNFADNVGLVEPMVVTSP